ncbi:MAG: hypothetical protein HQK72_02855 [Desulfamplus sp.]|nr:hypothetical protein [Desulfamplus sp.]
MSEEKQLYSYHAFLFPFTWKIDEKIKLETFAKSLEKAHWKYEPYEIKKAEKTQTEKNYSEFVYFYEYARDGIYNTNKEFKPNQTTYHFNFESYNSKYVIKIKDKDTPYELDIESISLKLYETGIAILSFQMDNFKYSNKEDIKKINDYGRRTYPQFLPLDVVRKKFLPEYIDITGLQLDLKEDFSSYENENKDFNISNNQNPADLPKFIKNILGKNFTNNKNEKENKVFVNPIIDDRMFVICWYGNNEESERLTKFCDNQYKYEHDDFWYSFIFIDKDDPTSQSKTMLPELLRNHTYNRWAGYNTIYGITRYSFMVLSKNDSYAKVIVNHVKTMYHQLVVLTLAQRTSILNFSKRITDISNIENNITKDVSQLHKDYIKFVNKLYFNEITAQDQGIELYDMMLNRMRIKENIKDLAGQIRELHDYAELEEQKKSNEVINKITKIGLYVMIPTLVTGFFGMNILDKPWICWSNWLEQFLLGQWELCGFESLIPLVVGLAFAGVIDVLYIRQKKNKTEKEAN